MASARVDAHNSNNNKKSGPGIPGGQQAKQASAVCLGRREGWQHTGLC